jgi:hypothetical protein
MDHDRQHEPTYGEEIARRWPDVVPYLPQRSGSGTDQPQVHLHLHQHDAPAVPLPTAEQRGWALLHALVPYLVIAALVAFIVCGSLAILAYAFTMVMAMLLAIVASAAALAGTAVALLAGIALAAAVIGHLLHGGGTTVTGNKNTIYRAPKGKR